MFILFLKSSKGVIRCRELENCKTDEIIEHLKGQGVTDAKRMIFYIEDVEKLSSTYISTFNQPIVPKETKIGYQIAKVDCYVPNLLRCYCCQKFGHHEDKCNGIPLCGKYSFVGGDHQLSTCTNSIKCANCGLNYATSSKECSFWLTQKEILSVKYKQNVSFEAKRIVAQQQNIQAR